MKIKEAMLPSAFRVPNTSFRIANSHRYELALVAACALLLFSSLCQSQEVSNYSHRPLAVEDLYLFDGPQTLVLSPQEDFAVYARQWIDREQKAERFSLW